MLDRRPDAAARRQGLDQRPVDRMADDQQRRHAALEIVLGDERLEDAHFGRARCLRRRLVLVAACRKRRGLDRDRVLDVLREVRPIAQVAAAANHRQIDAGAAAVDLDREHVGVDDAAAGVVLDRLLVQHARQRADPVADLGRLLELQRLGALQHLGLERIHQLLLLALQEALGVGDVLGVVLDRDVVDARPRAALDLVQQARPGAVGEHRVLAGAQVKHLLHQLDRILHRPGGRERAEVAVLLVDRAAVVGDARIAPRFDLQIGIALVVDEADVEARRQRLDQVVLEQQRLGLGAHDGRLHAGDARDHVAGPDRAFAAGVAFREVARDALLQLARLADVEHATARRRRTGRRRAGSAAPRLQPRGARGQLARPSSPGRSTVASSPINDCAAPCSTLRVAPHGDVGLR